ncbi:Programmed cell death protein 6 [Mycena sanguinolenta]|uniref:Programmed cell death protein 6 n=1 Tax=Mycena sanguinolenta TaxID=230812 RepID=A0A8H6XYI2_9AGAR|nr:Programmed cell death protein 6 [Mycena sanguinolenta]
MAYPGQQYGPPSGGPPNYGGGGGGYRPPPGGPPPHGGGYAPPPGGPPGGGYNAGYGGPPGGGYGAGGHPGGFAPQGGQGPPPGADPQLWNWFSSVDMDRSGAITAQELERALINGDWSPFDLDTVKLLMSIFDTDRSGTIGFNEFAGLWKYIKDWQNVFKHFDRDRSGSIDGNELRDALAQFGFNLSPHLLVLVQKKYDVKAGAASARPGMAPPGITFDRFVRACVVVKQLSEVSKLVSCHPFLWVSSAFLCRFLGSVLLQAFQRLDTDRDGWIQIGYEGFMETVLSLP